MLFSEVSINNHSADTAKLSVCDCVNCKHVDGKWGTSRSCICCLTWKFGGRTCYNMADALSAVALDSVSALRSSSSEAGYSLNFIYSNPCLRNVPSCTMRVHI